MEARGEESTVQHREGWEDGGRERRTKEGTRGGGERAGPLMESWMMGETEGSDMAMDILELENTAPKVSEGTHKAIHPLPSFIFTCKGKGRAMSLEENMRSRLARHRR